MYYTVSRVSALEESGSQDIQFSNVYGGTTGNYNTLGITAFDSNNNTNLCGLEIVKDSDKITIRQPQDLTGINYREMDIPIGGDIPIASSDTPGIVKISYQSIPTDITPIGRTFMSTKDRICCSGSSVENLICEDNNITIVRQYLKATSVTPDGVVLASDFSLKDTIIKSVTGSVSDGKLKITVNGVSSGDIPLPQSGVKYYFNTTPTIRCEGPTVIESTSITQTMSSGYDRECYNGVAYLSGTLNEESRTFPRKFDLNDATEMNISNLNITKFDSGTYGPYTGNFILHNVYYGSSSGALYGDITYQNGEMSFNPSVIGNSYVTSNEWIYIKITENTTFEEIS